MEATQDMSPEKLEKIKHVLDIMSLKEWTQDEKEALEEGCKKHGVGNWAAILMDPEYFPRLFKAKYKTRCPDDLKNRFRLYNADAYHEHLIKKLESKKFIDLVSGDEVDYSKVSPFPGPGSNNEKVDQKVFDESRSYLVGRWNSDGILDYGGAIEPNDRLWKPSFCERVAKWWSEDTVGILLTNYDRGYVDLHFCRSNLLERIANPPIGSEAPIEVVNGVCANELLKDSKSIKIAWLQLALHAAQGYESLQNVLDRIPPEIRDFSTQTINPELRKNSLVPLSKRYTPDGIVDCAQMFKLLESANELR